MNRERLKLWIDSLRSGAYQQGKHCLRMEDSFCCLGVLCDISQQGDWDDLTEKGTRIYRTPGSEPRTGYPPERVEEWLGVHESDFNISMDYLQAKAQGLITRPAEGFYPLSALNDDGAPFSLIADILQDVLDGVLVFNESQCIYEPSAS